jgi:Uma2 family endonuclease
MSVQLTRRRFTVDQYEAMGRAGILGEDDRVELLEGEIVEMTPIGARHAACVLMLTDLLAATARTVAYVSVQNPLSLDADSQVHPDLMLLSRRSHRYIARTPEPQDVLLVIEVADTTLVYDRQVKIPLYASAGIPEVWLVDLQARTVTSWLDPAGRRYERTRILREGDSVSPTLLPDASLSVADIFGPDDPS